MSADASPSAAADLNRRILRSEQSFVQMLSMMQHLFLEPVVPVPPAARVFVNVEQINDFHQLMWLALEPLLDAGEERSQEDILEASVVQIYKYSAFWTVYISYCMTHDAAQQALRDTMRSDQKFALLARDAAVLRPDSSLASCLQLIRVRPWQMRRYLLHAAGILSGEEFGGRFRRGVFAARGAARQLLQVTETSRLEHMPLDQRFMAELSRAVPKSDFFDSVEACILWKGPVQVGLEEDCRLVLCYDRMILLRRATHFWATTTYDIVGKWILDREDSNSRISGSLFSAREVGGNNTSEGPILYGVHIVTNSGIDWRVILKDKLASSTLLSAVKEMHTDLDQRAGILYNVTLALEPQDEWNEEKDGPEPPREYLGKSPEELKETLRDMRMQYERDGAIVIDSEASKLMETLGGRDSVLALFMPVMADIAALQSDTAYVSCCADTVVYCGFREDADDWIPSWKRQMGAALDAAREDTLLRDNSSTTTFTVKLLQAWCKSYIESVFRELGTDDDTDFDELCHRLTRAIVAKVALPSPALAILSDIRNMMRQIPRLEPYVARAMGAMLLLRVVGPALTVSGMKHSMRLAKFLVALVSNSSSDASLPVEKHYDSMKRYLQTLTLEQNPAEKAMEEDAFAHESFVADDDVDIDSTLIFLLDKLLVMGEDGMRENEHLNELRAKIFGAAEADAEQ